MSYIKSTFTIVIAFSLGMIVNRFLFFDFIDITPSSLTQQKVKKYTNTVMCFILTQPKNIVKARMVNSTWAPLCDEYVFVTGNETIPGLPCLSVPVQENRSSLMAKTVFMILYLHKQYGHKFDFFFKADDDTYLLVDNLREFMQDLNPQKKILAGRRFKKFMKQGYMSGGAGYLISQAALHAIADSLENEDKPCFKQKGVPEDVGLGHCAEHAGVEIVDSLDIHKLERFHPFNLPSMWWLDTSSKYWINDYNYHPMKNGSQCCSPWSISYHYINPNEMFLMHNIYLQSRHKY